MNKIARQRTDGHRKKNINKYGNVLHLTWLAIKMQLDVFIEAFQLHMFAFIFIFPFKNCFRKNLFTSFS